MDTEGFLLAAKITDAGKSDSYGLQALLSRKQVKNVQKIWVDMGYQGEKNKQKAKKVGIDLEVVKRPPCRIRVYDENWKCVWIPIKRAFSVLPRRWVVERTFAWIGRYRGMSKDYEYLVKTSEQMLYLSMTRTMLNRCLSMI